MRFAHIADCHLDSWREPEMKDVVVSAFEGAVDNCVSERVDFILITGDLFHGSSPDMSILRTAAKKLREANEQGIPVYAIPGSHDFSMSGKTILKVLEAAGLFFIVSKGASTADGKLNLTPTIDKKTGATIFGVIGKKGALERGYFDHIDREALEMETNPKIFAFHSAIEEYKPAFLKEAEGVPLSLFPKGFDYYAGGHVHDPMLKVENGYGTIAFTGALYPANFLELEKFGKGFYNIVTIEDGKTTVDRKETAPMPVEVIKFDATGKSPAAAEQGLLSEIEKLDLKGKIVLLRITGILSNGKPTDIDFGRVRKAAMKRGAEIFKKSVTKLSSKTLEEIRIDSTKDIGVIEQELIENHIGKIKVQGLTPGAEKVLIKNLMERLDIEKSEGENNATFEQRVLHENKELVEDALK